jgi:Fur family ferric uptake transcriptional regulator
VVTIKMLRSNRARKIRSSVRENFDVKTENSKATEKENPEKVNAEDKPEEALPLELRSRLTSELRAKGFRMTPQREKILDIFHQLPEGEHLSAEDLYHLLQRENTDISLATSYRTLKLLVSMGVLRELDFAEDHKHYELSRNPDEPHHHIICVECGKTEEFESSEVMQLAVAISQQKQFKLIDVQLKLFALCSQCAQEKKTESVS